MKLGWFQFEAMFRRGCVNLVNNKCKMTYECKQDNCVKFKRLKETWDRNGFIPSYINK